MFTTAFLVNFCQTTTNNPLSPSKDEWKKIMVCPYNKLVLSNNKEWALDMQDESQNHYAV